MAVFRKETETQQAGTGSVESLLQSILNALNSSNSSGATEATLVAIQDCLNLIKQDSAALAFKTKLLQVDKVGTVTYLGYADAGSGIEDTVWAIQKWTETGPDASAEWADGDKLFDNVWNDRLTLTYS